MKAIELQNIYKTNLKNLRIQAGLSQAALAEKASITDKFYNDIETGRKWGSFDTLVNLATALEVSPYELFLPQSDIAHYDTERTRRLMHDLRKSLCATVDVVEEFLSERSR